MYIQNFQVLEITKNCILKNTDPASLLIPPHIPKQRTKQTKQKSPTPHSFWAIP